MSPVTWTLLGLAIGIAGLLVGIFKYLFDLNREVGNLKTTLELAKVADMRGQVDRLVYREQLADERAFKEGHSPHTPEADAALEALERGGLTEEELREAICALTEDMKTERNGIKWLQKGVAVDRAKADLRDLLKEKARHGLD
jgi:hypothetical protein